MKAALTKSHGLWLAVSGVAVLVLAVDQVSKSLVVAADPGRGDGGTVSVRLVRNTGASFGIGAGHPLVITLTAAAVLAVALVLLAHARSRVVAVSLAVVVGCAAGNLADRLFRGPGPGRGAVVDWIHVVGYPATFNMADVAIRLGAVCAVIAALLTSQAGPGQGITAGAGRRQAGLSVSVLVRAPGAAPDQYRLSGPGGSRVRPALAAPVTALLANRIAVPAPTSDRRASRERARPENREKTDA
jgi:signal peptidase II